MKPRHSWKWLTPRFSSLRSAAPARTSSRPCLPLVEQLEDRILLDGQTQAIIVVCRNQIALHWSEVAFLQSAIGNVGGGNDKLQDAFLKIETEFLKIDAVLDKASTEAIVGLKILPDAATHKIDEAFNDIISELKILGDANGELLPAVQKIRDAALGTLDSIGSLLPAVQDGALKIDPSVLKLDLNFLKFEDEFLKIDGVTDKWTADFFNNKLSTDKQDTLQIKLDTAYLKLDDAIGAMGDGSVFTELKGEVDQLKLDNTNFLIGLLQPPPVTTPT